MQKITSGENTTSNEMMVLVLKAQTNHIAHMEQDLRNELIILRQDMDRRFEEAKIESQLRFKQIDKQFEQAKIENQLRSEQVDKRFEQVDKRFDDIINRIDSFMKWSFSTTLLVGGFVIAAICYL